MFQEIIKLNILELRALKNYLCLYNLMWITPGTSTLQ